MAGHSVIDNGRHRATPHAEHAPDRLPDRQPNPPLPPDPAAPAFGVAAGLGRAPSLGTFACGALAEVPVADGPRPAGGRAGLVGLVSSAISRGGDHAGSDRTGLAALWQPRFPGAELVEHAADLLPAIVRGDAMREGPSWEITVSPGTIRVRTRDYARAERTDERQRRAARAAADMDATWLAEGDEPPEPLPTRGTIQAWTRKSRARLVARLAELDYSRLYGRFLICLDCRADRDDGLARCPACGSARHTTEDRSNRLPAMLTLTYPGDWLTACPDAETMTGHFDALTKRYREAWGEPFRGPWKREFQNRGAPHVHASTTPPGGRAIVKISPRTVAALAEDRRVAQKLGVVPVGGRVTVDFNRWLSIAWAEVVDHPDDEEYRNHLLAGTGKDGVDYAQGISLTDPRRMAVYFTKYGSGGSKEYQNRVPHQWLDAVATCLDCDHQYDADLHECPDCGHPEAEIDYHGSAGRFWGVRGLRSAVAVRHVSPDTGIAAGRIARRWYAAKGLTKQTSRPRTDQATGRTRYRRTTVRKSLFAGNRGFLTVNDGPGFASQLGRYLTHRHAEQRRNHDAAELARIGRPQPAACIGIGTDTTLTARLARLPALKAAAAARRASRVGGQDPERELLPVGTDSNYGQ